MKAKNRGQHTTYSGQRRNNVSYLSLKRQEKQMNRLAEIAWSVIAAAALIAIVAVGGSITFPY